MKRFMIAGILFLILAIGFGIFYYEGTLAADPTSDEYTQFVIDRGAPVNTIINDLADADLIRNRIVFLLMVKQLGIENEIQAGLYRLSPAMTAKEIANSLTSGSDDIWITFIEGLRKEEIAQILSVELGIPESEFIKEAEEGKLFPDTYLVPRTATLQTVLDMFEQNYNAKFTEELQQQAQQAGMTENQVLTIASMVEREANTPATMQEVASIIVKRWKNDWPLEIDATVQYILGYQEGTGTWWKETLTAEDLAIDSQYNTRKYAGLPPGPIASPGLDAIKATINADETTPYWFYISNKDGSEMHYATTLEEHNTNIEKYLR